MASIPNPMRTTNIPVPKQTNLSLLTVPLLTFSMLTCATHLRHPQNASFKLISIITKYNSIELHWNSQVIQISAVNSFHTTNYQNVIYVKFVKRSWIAKFNHFIHQPTPSKKRAKKQKKNPCNNLFCCYIVT